MVATFLTVFSLIAYADQDVCLGISFGPPLLRPLNVTSRFNPARHHMGIDYAANGDAAIAMADGIIEKIAWEAKPQSTKGTRSGSLVKGWGRYVIIRHVNGSQTLYAHLEKDGTKNLKVGQSVKAGDLIGKTDSTGGVSGPHLHLEYSPAGNVYNNPTKADPDRCIARVGALSVESYLSDAKAVCQIFVDGKLIGENQPGQKSKLPLSLRPGKYPIRMFAKQVTSYRKVYCSVELDEPFTILDSKDADLGPGMAEELEQGKAIERILLVK